MKANFCTCQIKGGHCTGMLTRKSCATKANLLGARKSEEKMQTLTTSCFLLVVTSLLLMLPLVATSCP
jgi:hypothetical protein